MSFKLRKLLKQALFIAPVLLLTCYYTSCKKTEDQVFQKDNNFELYLWENYQGVKIFESPDSFNISPINIHQFSINSVDPNTSKVVTIKAGLFGDLNTQDTLIVFCHGGQYHMDYYFEQIKTLYYSGAKSKYNILSFDYQGLGLSMGETSFKSMINDAEGIGNWLGEYGFSSDHVILYGQGIGSLAACHLAQKFNFNQNYPKKLILENPIAKTDFLFSSGTQVNVPNSYFNQPTIDNLALVRGYEGSLLVLLSEKDEKFNPQINGEELFKIHKGSFKDKKMVNANHSGLVSFLGFPEYCNLIDSFIIHP